MLQRIEHGNENVEIPVHFSKVFVYWFSSVFDTEDQFHLVDSRLPFSGDPKLLLENGTDRTFLVQ